MERFDFSFALHLGERLYSHTDNLSKDLQGTKMADIKKDIGRYYLPSRDL